MTAIRLPVSFVLSLCATATLFWCLALLTAADPRGTFVPVIPKIDFTKHIPDTETQTHPPVRPPIPKPTPTPVNPVAIDTRKTQLTDPGPSDQPLPNDWFGPGTEGLPTRGDPIKLGHSGGSDRGPIPQVRMEPDYPAAAKDRHIEGRVTFRFTVAVDGSVKDIEIVDSQPPRIWDDATKRAVSTWKYQPATKDGKPVEQSGVTVTYRFELER
jgi:protein TonB